MIVTRDISLREFEPWQGAVPTYEALSVEELDQLESELERQYPDGIDETELNDLFWFEEDWIFKLAGHGGEEEEDDEEEEDEEEEDEDDDC